MTWSLIARDGDGRFGLVVASRFFAVGALCLHSRAGVGAVATQALVNPLYGPQALDLLELGRTADDVVREVTDADAGAAQRQLHVLPASGPGAACTGAECVGWHGHLVRADFSVAGNMLAGESVLQATADAFESSAGRPLAERLIAAMRAGEAEGGDKRGRQGAALRIQGFESYADLDLRVDDHHAPLAELARLYERSFERFQPFVACLPRRDCPAGETDRARIEAAVEEFHARRAQG